jgi:hypothetical protein
MGDLGDDKYFAHIDRLHGSTLNAALETARNSNDPEMRFTAAIHDNIPEAADRKNIGTIAADKLRVGQTFTYGGLPMKVTEDADGYKVLSGLGEDVPVEALKDVPIDRGSLRMEKGSLQRLKSDGVAPFSRRATPTGLILSGLEASFSLAEANGLPAQRDGVQCHYYWKEMLRPGLRFTDKNGRVQEITPRRIKALADNYSRAAAHGFEACLPVGSHNPEKSPNAGWLKRVEVRPDGSLWGLHQFLGSEDAVKQIVASNKSSISTIDDYEDEHNNIYPELIVHNAILPHPRISGLQGFQPALAASRGQAIAWTELSLAAPTQEIHMDLSMLRTKLGAAATVPDEQIPALAAQRITVLEAEAAKVGTLTGEKTELSNKVSSLNLELSRAKPPVPTARELHFASKAVAQARKAAIEGGAITVAVADAAEKRFLKKNVDLGKMELSRAVEPDDHTLADGLTNLLDFYESVAGNKPAPAPGEKSGKQDLSLSREVPGANGGNQELPYVKMAERYNASHPNPAAA